MTKSPYYPVLDFARIVAAIGVVWIHVAGTDELLWTKAFGRFAVPFFACSAVYLAYGTLARHPGTTIRDYVYSRFCRVYLPFLVWSVFYLAFRNFSSLFVEHTGFTRPSLVEFFWNGDAIQLWFLPFILVMTCFAFVLAHLVRGAPVVRLPLAGVLIGGAIAIALKPAPGFIGALGYGVGLGYEALPACAAALGLAMAGGDSDTPLDHAPPSVRLSFRVVGCLMLAAWFVGVFLRETGNGMANLAGFAALMVSLTSPSTERVALAAQLAATSFGIYLIHPVFVEGLQHILPKFGFHERTPSLEVAIFVTSVIASCAAVALLRASTRTRWLTG
jgi:surface polysaccharide O-acyltransferase-like enzyme